MDEKSSENEHAENEAFDGFPTDVPPEIDEQAAEVAVASEKRIQLAVERWRTRIASELARVLVAGATDNLLPHEIAYRVLQWLERVHGFAAVVPGAPSAEERAAMQQPAGAFIPHEVILQKLLDRAKIEHGALLAEIQRLRTRDVRIPSLDELDALLARYRAQSHGEPIDLLGAIQTAEARANAARVAPSGRRHLLLDCAAWALAAVCEIDGAQHSDDWGKVQIRRPLQVASQPSALVDVRPIADEGSGP